MKVGWSELGFTRLRQSERCNPDGIVGYPDAARAITRRKVSDATGLGKQSTILDYPVSSLR
jgi:hypothetical protein